MISVVKRSGVIDSIKGEQSSVIVQDCENLTVNLSNAIIYGSGNGKQKPLITIVRSKNIRIISPTIAGKIEGKSKQSWKDSVPNGILICPFSKEIAVEDITASYLHMGVIARGEGFSIKNGKIRYCSGDFIHCQADNFSISGLDMRYSLEVWSYDEIHRDAIHIYQYKKKYKKLRNGKSAKVLSNGLIDNNLIYFPTDKSVHQFCKTADGIMGTDGVFENIKIANNRVFTETQNGIRFAPMFNSAISSNNKVRHTRFFK